MRGDTKRSSRGILQLYCKNTLNCRSTSGSVQQPHDMSEEA